MPSSWLERAASLAVGWSLVFGSARADDVAEEGGPARLLRGRTRRHLGKTNVTVAPTPARPTPDGRNDDGWDDDGHRDPTLEPTLYATYPPSYVPTPSPTWIDDGGWATDGWGWDDDAWDDDYRDRDWWDGDGHRGEEPTGAPTFFPTVDPTFYPTVDPTREPRGKVAWNGDGHEPTNDPTEDPTAEPAGRNDDGWDDDGWDGDGHHAPAKDPTADPTEDPTAEPSPKPTAAAPALLPAPPSSPPRTTASPAVDRNDDGRKDDGRRGDCPSAESCREQAMRMGFPAEHFYDGDHSNAGLYGCFSENEKAYWGRGGTYAKRTHELSGRKYRIRCKDDGHPTCVRAGGRSFPLCPHERDETKYCDGDGDCAGTDFCDCGAGRELCETGVNPCDGGPPTHGPAAASPSRSPARSPADEEDADDDGRDDTLGADKTTPPPPPTMKEGKVYEETGSNDYRWMVHMGETQTRCREKIMGSDGTCVKECREVKFTHDGDDRIKKWKGPLHHGKCDE